jgi:hypothetical protein
VKQHASKKLQKLTTSSKERRNRTLRSLRLNGRPNITVRKGENGATAGTLADTVMAVQFMVSTRAVALMRKGKNLARSMSKIIAIDQGLARVLDARTVGHVRRSPNETLVYLDPCRGGQGGLGFLQIGFALHGALGRYPRPGPSLL